MIVIYTIFMVFYGIYTMVLAIVAFAKFQDITTGFDVLYLSKYI